MLEITITALLVLVAVSSLISIINNNKMKKIYWIVVLCSAMIAVIYGYLFAPDARPDLIVSWLIVVLYLLFIGRLLHFIAKKKETQ